ncbi:glycosyltransferase [Desulfovibrio sp. JC022]|uniref:CgeB family protein n=1 Tax=Desulfovibrio sp. JC022 TaxID=2593642 RepID=UPI0013D11083|nr:glycosyltransferase [Desulfovibrio sp. JC022]NDV22466.1 glycosyltransferase [Desulfovibrio sp. JC022]
MSTNYTAEVIRDETELLDICIMADGRKKHMWGKYAQRRETDLATQLDEDKIPLLIGSGIGVAARELLKQKDRTLLILDCETEILAASGLKEELRAHSNLVWINTSSPRNAAKHIMELESNSGKKVQLLKNPFYLRLSQFYLQTEKLLIERESKEVEFPVWPKFQNEKPRILLLTSQYFLMGEIVAACQRQGVPHMFINMDAKEMELEQFVTRISAAIDTFRPDFVLTVNHLGVDQEGVLNTLLHKFQLPLASWFVDNPLLILPLYQAQANEDTTIFTWDADRMDSLREMGFSNIFHLPLGTDQTRFLPSKGCTESKWARDISFVGNSMVHKTAKRFTASKISGLLAEKWKELAHAFGQGSEHSVVNFLKTDFPELYPEYENLVIPHRKLAFETLIIWQATLEYRLSCVQKTLDFNPLIVGDDGWKQILKSNRAWEYHHELSYYDDLPRFYPCSKINFNCTSQQMKGAVNQRVFDVPACNGFILTDHRYQMEKLFEPGKEIAVYNSLAEIPQLVDKYLNDESARKRIIKAARKRILNEHTYDCRIKTLIKCMRQVHQ